MLSSSRLLVPPAGILAVSVRGTVWPSMYIEPIFRKEEQSSLDEEQRKQLAFAPVKAVRNNVSSSVFFDPTLFRLTKMIMRNGRMHLARELLDKALFEIKKAQLERLRQATSDEEREQIETNPAKIATQAIRNMQPVVITKAVKRGGARYQVPHPVSPQFSEFLAMKWLLDTLKERPRPQKENFYVVLGRELLAGFHNEGKVVKRKLDMHRACEANKAYAHYRWG